MEHITSNGLTVYYDPEEREAAEMIQKACQRSTQRSTHPGDWNLLRIAGYTF
jgi:hypothetical protein